MIRLYRAVLLLYPASFRRDYGDAMIQLLEDQRCHGAVPTWRLAVHTLSDAALTAPQMRWESAMSRVVLIAVAAAVVLLAALSGSPVVAGAVVVLSGLALLALSRGRLERPVVSATQAQGWLRWLAGGLLSLGVGAGVLVGADGNELSATGWSVWFVSWAAAVVLIAIGLQLAVTRRRHPA